jgi:uncharacterized protein (TIGR02594 family)
VQITDGVPIWIPVAFSQFNISRFPAGSSNPEIEKYHKTTNRPHYDDKAAWCSSYVNWCLLQCSINGTNDTLARSWLRWGLPLDVPKFGCIAVFARQGASERRGHVGFLVSEGQATLFVLGGNQSGKVCIRSHSTQNLLGYRWVV